MLYFYRFVIRRDVGGTMHEWLASPTKYAEAEFNKLVFNVAPEAAYRHRAEGRPVNGFSDIVHDVMELLIERYGFMPVEEDASFNVDETKHKLFCPVRAPEPSGSQDLYDQLSDWLRAHDLRELDPGEYPSQYAMMLNEVTPREQVMRDYLAGGDHVVIEPVDIVPVPRQRIQVEAWWPFWEKKS